MLFIYLVSYLFAKTMLCSTGIDKVTAVNISIHGLPETKLQGIYADS